MKMIHMIGSPSICLPTTGKSIWKREYTKSTNHSNGNDWESVPSVQLILENIHVRQTGDDVSSSII